MADIAVRHGWLMTASLECFACEYVWDPSEDEREYARSAEAESEITFTCPECHQVQLFDSSAVSGVKIRFANVRDPLAWLRGEEEEGLVTNG